MNKKYQTLIAVFCVVIIVAFIISCRKNETIGNAADGAPVPASVLQQLKSWHAANMAAQPGNNVNTQGVTKAPKILKPIWDKARYRMLASGGQAIAVDAPGYNLSNGAYNFYRTFIYTQNNGAVTDGQIVEFYAKEGALKNVQQYLALYNQDVIPGFNGAIITYDINYHYKASRVYKDGRRINQIAYVKNLPASQALKDTLQINSKLRVAGTRVFDEGDGVSTGTGTVDDDDGCLWTVEDFFTTDGVFLYRVILDVTCPNDGHPGDAPPTPGDGGGDTSGGSGGGGGGGGGTSPQDPPNCDSYTKIINGKRVTINCTIPPKSLDLTKLPPNNTNDVQDLATCVFKTIEWVSKFYGSDVTVQQGVEAYALQISSATSGYTYGQAVVDAYTNGVFMDGPALRNFVGSNYFNYIIPTNLYTSIDNGHPVMATLPNPNSSNSGHEVMITGYDASGNMVYFDPQTGTYPPAQPAGNFNNVAEITGLKN